MRASRRFPLVVCAAGLALSVSAGCERATTGLGDGARADGGPTSDGGSAEVEYCMGSYRTVSPAGEIESVEVPCARGAVCGEGTNYQICPAGGGPAKRGFEGILTAELLRERMAEMENYPWCDRATCALHGLCFFQPGCEEPRGLCCQTVCGSGGIRAQVDCEQMEGCSLVYCGCDGQTFEGLPTRPYKHPGPCRED